MNNSSVISNISVFFFFSLAKVLPKRRHLKVQSNMTKGPNQRNSQGQHRKTKPKNKTMSTLTHTLNFIFTLISLIGSRTVLPLLVLGIFQALPSAGSISHIANRAE